MAHGRSREQWSRLSVLLATLVNQNRDPKKDPIMPGKMDIYNTRGELKKPVPQHKPPLSVVLAASGAVHKPKG